jgi:RNA polymerase sigma-70 factor, ECF subfamily
MTVVLSALTASQDRELLRHLASGDRLALSELYLSYHSTLARFLSRCLWPDSVDAVINDTFMEVWQRSRNFSDASHVSTWVMGIAYKKALKLHNRESLCVTQSERTERCINSKEEIDTWDSFDQALARLPRKQQLALQLVYCMNCSLEEIAVITDAPSRAVNARLSRARRKLSRLLPVVDRDIDCRRRPGDATD